MKGFGIKLIGSKTEKLTEEALRGSKERLFNCLEDDAFKKELTKSDPLLKTAYELDYITGQGEDIRTFITDKKEIYIIEISRVDKSEPPIIEQVNFHEYKRNLRGRNSLLNLMIALKLIEEDLKAFAHHGAK